MNPYFVMLLRTLAVIAIIALPSWGLGKLAATADFFYVMPIAVGVVAAALLWKLSSRRYSDIPFDL